MHQKKRVVISIIAVLIIGIIVTIVMTNRDNKTVEASTKYSEYVDFAPEGSYMEYLSEHSDKSKASDLITINAGSPSSTSDGTEVLSSYEGKENVIMTTGTGFAEWKTDINEDGFYEISVEYMTDSQSDLPVERSIYIDGELFYDEAAYVKFERSYADVKRDISKDIFGNDIKPDQVQQNIWQEKKINDASGYFNEPLRFYLSKGSHLIRFVSEGETLYISKIELGCEKEPLTYDEYIKQYEGTAAVHETVKIQAEDAKNKSDKANYPVNDRTSSFTEPQSARELYLNTVGGNRWQDVGSRITWELTVPAAGLYKIVPRSKQDLLTDLNVYRKLLIDGEVPFAEAKVISFGYDSDWQCKPLGNGETDYLFYFEAGKTYEISLEVTLGDMNNILRRVKASVEKLNEIYRSILMVTGASPDKYRDYSFEKIIPGTLADIEMQAAELAKIVEEFQSVNSGNGERISQLTKLQYIVNRMAEDPDEIAGKFSSFKDNIASTATWITEMSRQPLIFDYIELIPEGMDNPKAEAGFFGKAAYQVKLLAASFVVDYSKVGIIEEPTESSKEITVWLSSGRDQLESLRSLVNSEFTPKTGITVNLELVNGGTLLPSVLAGKGPDVSLGNGIGDPINFALRDAVYDLSRFSDIDEVAGRYGEQIMRPYTFEGKVYAVPETVDFNMLFYRKDIFEELGLKVPNTWNEWDAVISELSKKNMSIGMPHDLNMLLTYMYQSDTDLYNGEGETVNLDDRESYLGFEKLTEYYTLYNFPTEYDFVNRFRSGEMPLAIADYAVYNQLSLFSPEIKGDWGMALMPGTVKEDGSIDRTIPYWGSSTMILNRTKDADSAWEFVKWWVSDDIQLAYCNEMETVINASAKQQTSSRNALAGLQWNKEDLQSLLASWDNIKGTPQVPGGYFVDRIYNFAFNKVKNDKEDPTDVMQKYIEPVNSELTRKRKEFGLE